MATKTLGQIAYEARYNTNDPELWAGLGSKEYWEHVGKVIAVEAREECAKIADARRQRCEAEAQVADADERTTLLSLAWQFDVLAAEMRKRG